MGQMFAETFMLRIKNFTAAGAGLPIKLNAEGNVDVAMEATLDQGWVVLREDDTMTAGCRC